MYSHVVKHLLMFCESWNQPYQHINFTPKPTHNTMRSYTIIVFCLFLFSSCSSQTSKTNEWVKGPDQTIGELYAHKTVANVGLVVLSFAELNKTSAGPFPGVGTPGDQLARVYKIMGMDAQVNQNAKKGTAFVEWGEAQVGKKLNYFVARLQPQRNDGKVFVVVTNPEDFGKIGGEQALFDDPLSEKNTGVVAATNRNGPLLTKDYPPLLVKRDRRGKELSNNWHSGQKNGLYARTDDPNSPRLFSLNVTGKQAKSTRQAIDKALREMSVKSPRYLDLTRMKVSKELLGSEHFITVGQSVLNGRKANLFISSSKAKGTDVFRISIRETPLEIYEKWGGIASILVSEGIITTTNAFGKKLDQVSTAGPTGQVKVYEAAFTKIMYQLAKGIMMTQAATTMRMTELNYDLLLGGDITDPFIGN